MRPHFKKGKEVIVIPRVKSNETKEIIRKAAIKVISEVGFHNCNTDKIAAAAGVSVGTIYNYFRNKEDILGYIFEVEHKNIKEFFSQLKDQKISIPEKIKSFLEKHFRRVMEDWNLSKILHDESNRPAQGLSREIWQYLAFVHSCLQHLLKEGIDEGTVYPDIDLEMTAAMIIGASGSLALSAYFQPEKIQDICGKAPGYLTQVFYRGIFIGDSFSQGQ